MRFVLVLLVLLALWDVAWLMAGVGQTLPWRLKAMRKGGAGPQLLDVRTPAEYATGFVPGSLNIPHTELRDRLDEVRDAAAGRPVRVMCQSGVRSGIAHRVLAQSGFDSASLSGGMLTLQAWLGARQSDVLERPEVLARA